MTWYSKQATAVWCFEFKFPLQSQPGGFSCRGQLLVKTRLVGELGGSLESNRLQLRVIFVPVLFETCKELHFHTNMLEVKQSNITPNTLDGPGKLVQYKGGTKVRSFYGQGLFLFLSVLALLILWSCLTHHETIYSNCARDTNILVWEQIIPDNKAWRVYLRKYLQNVQYDQNIEQKPVVALLIASSDKHSSDAAKLLAQQLKRQQCQHCIKRIMAKDVYSTDPLGLEAYNVQTYDDLLFQRVRKFFLACPVGGTLILENFQYIHLMVLPALVDLLSGTLNSTMLDMKYSNLNIIITTSNTGTDDLEESAKGLSVAKYEELVLKHIKFREYLPWKKDLENMLDFVSNLQDWASTNYDKRYRNINSIINYKQLIIPLTR
eukprot:TRINITY_DN9093_c0_g1_i3.p1 TRINITY_DN9093_c0_g1~~TRINITY_DN9093_c0_g1_i3.p1  ORF type:complete len:378 (+),score=0.39 TRINITY_DN9093_c0_g1_i3:80-1213(+)